MNVQEAMDKKPAFTPYKPLFIARNWLHNQELVKELEAMSESEWEKYCEEQERMEK